MTSSLPSADHRDANVYWRGRVPAARLAWFRLSLDELIQSEGQVDRLASLVEERYGLRREEAMQQVDSFFRRHSFFH